MYMIKGATSFLPGGGAKMRRAPTSQGLGREKRAEARRADAAGDRVRKFLNFKPL